MLLAVKLMLDWLQEDQLAQSLDQAISAVISEGEIRTYDMGGTHSTIQMAEAVIQNLE